MRRTLSAFLVLVLLMGAVGFIPALAEAPIELTFMHWEGVDSQAEFQQAIDVWEKDHPGYKIVQLPVSNANYMTKLTSMAASNTLPDLFQMPETYCIYWGQQGAYADMSDWFKDAPEKLDVSHMRGT